MTSAGFPIRPGRDDIHQNLQPQVWRRLQAAVIRRSTSPSEILLFGPGGIGKSVLLRRLYWDAFTDQDTETPLIVNVPPLPFQPLLWARRFLMEVCQQWVAFERRDSELAQSNLLPATDLIDLCNNNRLFPLAQALSDVRKMEEASDGAAFVLEWAFESVNQAAVKLQRPAFLMLDSPENAFWRENGETFYLTRLLQPLTGKSRIRRIWAMRRNSLDAHPFLAPIPTGAEPWLIDSLGNEAAAEFVAALAANYNLDYDEQTIEGFLHLWGGVPRYLENFIHKSADSLLPLTSAEQVVQTYVDDLCDGPSARDLQAALHPPLGETFSPGDLARVADAYLLFDENSIARKSVDARDERLLQRLAQAGLAVYQQGEWRASSVPLLSDFLRLFVARNYSRQQMDGALVALKRERLVESPLAAGKSEVERRLKQLRLLLHTFRGQNIPAHLFHSHRSSTADPISSAPLGKNENFWVPFCIGAFNHSQSRKSPPNAPPPIPTVVGWCFEKPSFYRSDEMLWVTYACDNQVVTTEEIEQIERSNKLIGREFGVGRTVAWIVTDSKFSPEAIEALNALGFLTSSWEGCENIAALMGETSGKRSFTEEVPLSVERPTPEEKVIKPAALEPIPAAEPEQITTALDNILPMEHELDAHATDSPSQPEVRIIEARSGNAMEHMVELHLPPRADMELVAADTIEQLATSCGFPEKAIGQMKMATLEACLNAIERSRNKEKEVRVRLEASPRKFTILIENEGDTFDPLAVEEPRIEDKLTQNYKRGWGLKLIRKFMDRVVFEPYDRGTRLRMEKMNPPAETSEQVNQHSEI